MAASEEVVTALRRGRKIRIVMPECDGLKEGRELVTMIQESCDFQLCYTQRLGSEPEVIVWRSERVTEAMRNYDVQQYQA